MAHIEFFGDSYQYAHRVLLHAVAPPEKWIVHPMMFRSECKCKGDPCLDEPGGGLNLGKYAEFLGLPRDAVLGADNPEGRLARENLVKDVKPHPFLFLDPDTGIAPSKRKHEEEFIRANLLVDIARQRGRQTVLVYDHAYQYNKLKRKKVNCVEVPFLCETCQGRSQCKNICNRCNAVTLVKRKLKKLCRGSNGDDNAIHCGAVIVRSNPCVCYVWVSTNPEKVKNVRSRLLSELPMPCWRLVSCPCCESPSP